jgi:hypothetical protein
VPCDPRGSAVAKRASETTSERGDERSIVMDPRTTSVGIDVLASPTRATIESRRAPYAGLNRVRFQGTVSTPQTRDTPGGLRLNE